MNYYERFGFSQTDELEHIQWVIDQKIADEENDPFGERHSDKMFILLSAKETFATPESRARYDQELADSMKVVDPDDERKALFEKWHKEANGYYKNGQYDLAKTAIDNAMQYISLETVNSGFYDDAADIYASLGLYPQALDLHNKSITLSPDESYGYYLKSVTLYNSIFEANLNKNKERDIWRELKANCELTISKAVAQEKLYDGYASICYGYLAEMHYVFYDGRRFPCSGQDNTIAEAYALKAVATANEPVSTVKRILDDISARRKRAAHLKRENADIRLSLEKIGEEIERRENSIIPTLPVADKYIYKSHSFSDFLSNPFVYNPLIIICFLAFLFYTYIDSGIIGKIFTILLLIIIGVVIISAIKLVIDVKRNRIHRRLRDANKRIEDENNRINLIIAGDKEKMTGLQRRISDNNAEIASQLFGLTPEPSINISIAEKKNDQMDN